MHIFRKSMGQNSYAMLSRDLFFSCYVVVQFHVWYKSSIKRGIVSADQHTTIICKDKDTKMEMDRARPTKRWQ